MKKWYRHRILLFFLAFFLLGNSVMVSRVQASGAELGLTLAELAAGSGGTAAFGSAALGVAIPLLLAVGTAYAGYKVYQNRKAIGTAFQKWYSTASTTAKSQVKSWLEWFEAGMANGEITDNTTVSIPSGVLDGVRTFVGEYSLSFGSADVVKLDSEMVFFNTLASEVTNSNLQTALANSSVISYAPVVIITVKSTGVQAVMCPYYYSGYYPDVLCLNVGSAITFNYGFRSHSTFTSLTSGTLALGNGYAFYYYSTVEGNAYSKISKLGSDCLYGPYGFNPIGTDIKINGNMITGPDTWDYTIKLILPKNSTALISSNLASNAILTPDNYKIISMGDKTVADNPYTDLGTTYTPTYVGNAEDQALEVTLTPEVVNKMNDYVVKGTADELDVVRTIDPSGIVAVPTPEEEDLTNKGLLEGVTDAIQTGVKGITDVIQGIGDFILTIPQVLADFWEKLWEWLQSILDAILSIPGLLVNTLQGILEWLFVPDAVAVEEFVDGLEGTISDRTGILTYPLSLVLSFLNQVLSLSSGDCILIMPGITIDGYHLMNRYEFNFTQYVNQSDFAELYQIYRLITNFILILAVLNLAIKKGSEIIRGN